MSQTIQDPIAGGTQSFLPLATNSGNQYILAFVTLPASDGINIPTPEYKPAKNGNKAYLSCQFDYPNEPSTELNVSYKIPLFVYTEDLGEFPDELHIVNKKGGKKVKVKTSTPVIILDDKEEVTSVNDIYSNILINTPVQPDGSDDITYYFVFTQIANDGTPNQQLNSNQDLESNTLYYSFDNPSGGQTEASSESTDYIADNQIVFTTVKLMDGNDVLNTLELGGLSTPFPGFKHTANVEE